MKNLLLMLLPGVAARAAARDPMISSWLTKYSGQYARLYLTATNLVTATFAIPTGAQTIQVIFNPNPTYTLNTAFTIS